MRDPTPLSQRFDLAYVHRRWWPWRWGLWLSAVLGAAAIAWAAYALATGDDRAFTSGAVSRAHSFIANDCAACHQPDPQRSGYWLPASDAACLSCHVAASHADWHALHPPLPHATGQSLGATMVSSDCAACHMEHRGADHDLTRLDDRLCVQCHGQLDSFGIGSQAARPPRGRTPDFRTMALAGEVTP